MFDFLFVRLEHVNLLLLNDVFVTALFFFYFFYVSFWLIQRNLNTLKIIIPSWVWFVPIVFLILFRVIGVGQVGNADTGSVGMDIFLAALIISSLVLIKKTTNKKKQPRRKCVDLILVLLLIMIATSTLMGLGDNSILGDEYFQFETAANYLQTKEFYRWDFTSQDSFIEKDGSLLEYDRAKFYTWLVATSMNFFGVSEWSARLPAALFFILFVLGVYFFMLHWYKDRKLAFLTAVIFVFSNAFISQARMVRMYSLFIVIAAFSSWCYIRAAHYYLNKKKSLSILYGLMFVFLALFALHLHQLMAVLLISLAAFIFFEWLYRLINERSFFNEKMTRVTRLLAGVIVAWIIILLADLKIPIIRGDLFSLGGVRNRVYEIYLFYDYPIYGVAIILFIVALWFFYKRDLIYRFLSFNSIFLIVLFIFFLDHGTASRYLLIVCLFVVPLVSVALYEILQGFSFKNKRLKECFVVLCFLVILVPASIKGIEPQLFLNKAPADRRNFDYQVAYDYIKQNMSEGEVVLGAPFRSFYWGPDSDADVIYVRRHYEQTVQDKKYMAALMFMKQKGWIVWPNGHYKIDGGVVEYVKKNAIAIHEKEEDLRTSNIEVYYYDFSNKTPSQRVAALLAREFDYLINGVLVRDKSGRILLYSDGVFRRIKSSDLFIACGYEWENVSSLRSDMLLDKNVEFIIGGEITSIKECKEFNE